MNKKQWLFELAERQHLVVKEPIMATSQQKAFEQFRAYSPTTKTFRLNRHNKYSCILKHSNCLYYVYLRKPQTKLSTFFKEYFKLHICNGG